VAEESSVDCSLVVRQELPGASRLSAIASGLAAWSRRFKICCRGPPQRYGHGNELKLEIGKYCIRFVFYDCICFQVHYVRDNLKVSIFVFICLYSCINFCFSGNS